LRFLQKAGLASNEVLVDGQQFIQEHSPMHCPYCGSEHTLDIPCTQRTEPQSKDPKRTDERPLAGLDNPFWKREEPAAANA